MLLISAFNHCAFFSKLLVRHSTAGQGSQLPSTQDATVISSTRKFFNKQLVKAWMPTGTIAQKCCATALIGTEASKLSLKFFLSEKDKIVDSKEINSSLKIKERLFFLILSNVWLQKPTLYIFQHKIFFKLSYRTHTFRQAHTFSRTLSLPPPTHTNLKPS